MSSATSLGHSKAQDVPGYEPTVGEGKALTMFGQTPGLAAGPPDDALWLIEEWDGRKWLLVAEMCDEIERDSLLHPE
jgi:hypothetical protein